MGLPPVVAELRANIGDYMARMAQARGEWEKTSAAIADPKAVTAAEASLVHLSKTTAGSSKEAGALGETSREAFGQMRSGAAGVLPGLGEVSTALGRVKEQLTGIREHSKALKVEVDRVTVALQTEVAAMAANEEGSRAFVVAEKRAAQLQATLTGLKAEQASASRSMLLAGAGGGAALGIGVGVGVGYEGVKAALAEQNAQALLRNAVDKTKESWAAYQPALESAAGQMRRLGFADSDTAQSAQKLTTALKDPEKALNLVGLAANIARARHVDLATATSYVQRIATGHVGTLGRLGLASKDAAGNTLTVKQSIDELGKAYGNAASAYAGTLQGKWDTFKAQLEHVEEGIGKGLIPVLSDALSEFEKSASWINENMVPTLKSLWSWFDEKIVPAIKRVIDITVGAYRSAFETASKALHGHSGEVSKVVDFLKLLAEFIATKVLPVVARFNAFILDLTVKALVPVIAVLAKVVDAFGWLVKGAGDAAAGVLNYFVRPVIDGMLTMAEKVVGAADSAFGWVPGIGGKLDGAKADIANFAASTNATLQSWASNAAQWGNDHTAAVAAAADAAKKATEKSPTFNISDDYSTGLQNVAAASHKKATDAAKKRASDLAALRKKDHDERLAALKKQKEELEREAAGALAAANRIAAKQEAQLKASLAAAQEAARQLDIANKLAGGGTGRVDIIDGAVLNRGYTFAQAAANIRPMTVYIQVAGSVTTENNLVQSVHEKLLTFTRTNINSGLA